jgi:hypothetical protein
MDGTSIDRMNRMKSGKTRIEAEEGSHAEDQSTRGRQEEYRRRGSGSGLSVFILPILPIHVPFFRALWMEHR